MSWGMGAPPQVFPLAVLDGDGARAHAFTATCSGRAILSDACRAVRPRKHHAAYGLRANS